MIEIVRKNSVRQKGAAFCGNWMKSQILLPANERSLIEQLRTSAGLRMLAFQRLVPSQSNHTSRSLQWAHLTSP